MAFNAALTVAATFAVGFQCRGSSTVIFSNHCVDQTAFWDAYGTLDILVDLAVTLLPLYLLFPVQMAWSKKGPVIVALSLRFLLAASPPLTYY